jgi:hypothetical protein
MIYLFATFAAIMAMVLGLMLALKFGNKKIIGSCYTITANGGKQDIYCDNCAKMVKDECLKP